MIGFTLSPSTVNLAYVLAAVLFVTGIKLLGSPRTARIGNMIAAAGMVVAVAFTLTLRAIDDYALIAAGMAIGAVLGVPAARRVKMTAMPQMVALLNGVGGAAAALVAVAEFHRLAPAGSIPADTLVASLASALIGALTFSGSLVAFAKLQELVSGRPLTFPFQQPLNAAIVVVALAVGAAAGLSEEPVVLTIAVALALVFGVLLVMPIGGADMPVVIALLNAFSGLSGVAAGFVLDNNALIIGGTLVGASGTLLSILMGRAMNRSLANVLFGAFGATTAGASPAAGEDGRTVRSTTADDVAVMLVYARRVVFVPGYGLAVAQAQHEVRQLADVLEARGVDVRYAIHPVAGRMPGHMNVLLAEANVPYDQLYEMERINPEFARTDVAVVVGANDVVNPSARNAPGSPIYGMPILDVDKSGAVVVIKRSLSPGFAGIDNPLFYDEKTALLFADAKAALEALLASVKQV
jgi:H+-translocating NAD(P) transhydrogenase subunit beta